MTLSICYNLSFTITEKLNLKSVHDYKYLQQSTCYSIDGVDDAEQFRIVVVLYLSPLYVLHMFAKNESFDIYN